MARPACEPAALDAIEHLLPGADDHLGRGGRRGGAEVGDEIGDGDVGLVSDGGDNGNRRGGNSAGDGFFVEGPEVFERAARRGR